MPHINMMEAVSQLSVHIPRRLGLCRVDRTNLTSTKANTLLQFPALYVSFPFQDPIQDAAVNSVPVSPSSPAAMVTRFPWFLLTDEHWSDVLWSVSFGVRLMLVSWADWGCGLWEADNGQGVRPQGSMLRQGCGTPWDPSVTAPLIAWLTWSVSDLTTVSLASALAGFMSALPLHADHTSVARHLRAGKVVQSRKVFASKAWEPSAQSQHSHENPVWRHAHAIPTVMVSSEMEIGGFLKPIGQLAQPTWQSPRAVRDSVSKGRRHLRTHIPEP